MELSNDGETGIRVKWMETMNLGIFSCELIKNPDQMHALVCVLVLNIAFSRDVFGAVGSPSLYK